MVTEDQSLPAVPDALTVAFSEFLASQIGLHFPQKRWADLLRGMSAVAKESGFSGPEACMRSLLLGMPLKQRQVEMLASHLSVGETYFFRDPAMFRVLEQDLLPQLIETRANTSKSLRIWSAGCCTGEEAYSVAAVISRLIPDMSGWRISILGTDINAAFLKKAESGMYREWSFRGVPEWAKQRYFHSPAAGIHEVLPAIRKMVRFQHLNLASDLYPSTDNGTQAMDIILCRNVLMYFDAAQITQVAGKFHRALVDGGWLIVSASEVGQGMFADFSPVSFSDAVAYRKSSGGPEARTDFRSAPTSAPVPAIPVPSERRAANTERSGSGFDTWLAAQNSGAEVMPVAVDAFESALDYFNKGAYEQAAAVLIASGLTSARALALLARSRANLGQLDDAVRLCAAAIEADKVNPGLRYLQAVILEEQGDIEAAVVALKRALYLDQDFILAHFALGNLCRRQDRLAEAARHYRIALDLLRNWPAAQTLPESDGMSAERLIEIILTKQGLA